MKKIFILTLICLPFFISCDINDENDGKFGGTPESGWIQFMSESSLVGDNVNIFKLPIKQETVTNPEQTIVTYTVTAITGEAPAGVEGTYTSTISKDEFNGFLEIPINTMVNGPYTLEVKFTKVNEPSISLGLESINNMYPNEHTLKVCSGNIATNYDGSASLDGNVLDTFSSQLTPTDDPNRFLINTTWGDFLAAATGDPSYVGQLQYDGELIINEDYTVEIIGNDDSYATGGTGAYDPCSQTFELNLEQALFTDPFTVDVVLIAQ